MFELQIFLFAVNIWVTCDIAKKLDDLSNEVRFGTYPSEVFSNDPRLKPEKSCWERIFDWPDLKNLDMIFVQIEATLKFDLTAAGLNSRRLFCFGEHLWLAVIAKRSRNLCDITIVGVLLKTM